MTAKERLHLFVDELSETEAEDMLRYVAERRDRDDALLELLAAAPDDDEPTNAGEEAGSRRAWEEYRSGDSVPLEQVRRELR